MKYRLHVTYVRQQKYEKAYMALRAIPEEQRKLKVLLAMARLNVTNGRPPDSIPIFKQVLEVADQLV